MTSLRMNASKAEARRLSERVGSQYDEEWNKFEHESAHLYKFQIALDFRTSWSRLEMSKKEEGILKMTSQCKKNNVYLEGLNLAEWRVYNLHRTTIKTGGGKQIYKVSEPSDPQPESSKGFDAVRDAVRTSNA